MASVEEAYFASRTESLAEYSAEGFEFEYWASFGRTWRFNLDSFRIFCSIRVCHKRARDKPVEDNVAGKEEEP